MWLPGFHNWRCLLSIVLLGDWEISCQWLPWGLWSFGDVSTFLHHVKFRRKEKICWVWFFMAISQFSFPYVACPRALRRYMGFISTEGDDLEHRGGGSEWDRMVWLATCYNLQKDIKIRTEGWGLGKGTVRLAFMRACRFFWFVVQNRKVWSAGPFWDHTPVDFKEVTHSWVKYSNEGRRDY